MQPLQLIKHAFRRLRVLGPVAVGLRLVWIIRLGMRPQARSGFDISRGVDTDGTVPAFRLGVRTKDPFVGAYQTTPENLIRRTLASLPIDPRQYSFIDLGAGKGRSVMVAAEYGYRDLIAVEFVPELVDIAKSNFAKCGIPATTVLTDAADYEFPEGRLVAYLYNPFGPQVLRRVVERLRGRHAFVVYVRPVHASLFDGFELLATFSEEETVAIYRSQAAADGDAAVAALSEVGASR